MEYATPINAIVPEHIWKENFGTRRDAFTVSYCDDQDPIDDFPRVVEFKGKTYVRTGYNSDSHKIHYKEHTDVAFPVKC